MKKKRNNNIELLVLKWNIYDIRTIRILEQFCLLWYSRILSIFFFFIILFLTKTYGAKSKCGCDIDAPLLYLLLILCRYLSKMSRKSPGKINRVNDAF